MNKYKLSIITINRNNAEGLRKTIESVISQTFTDFEYIVIDGNSTDESVSIIKEYESRIQYWVSEPDSGIYNAMNKGILKATGDYCLFLNSGDYLISNNILGNVLSYLDDTEILFGDGKVQLKVNQFEEYIIPNPLTFEYLVFHSLFHPSTFIKRDLFNKYGLYNEKNKIVSDWEFFLKVINLNDISVRKIPYFISIAADEGISRNTNYTDLLYKEIEGVKNKYFSRFLLSYIESNVHIRAENIKLNIQINEYKKPIKVIKLFLKRLIKNNN